MIKELGYVGIRSADVAGWRKFATHMLGMQVIGRGDGIALRMDGKCHRYLIDPAETSSLGFFGFDVGSREGLDQLIQRLTEGGIAWNQASEEECRARQVTACVWTIDPDGHRAEFFYGLAEATTPFEPSKPIGGFRTGELGMGHVVLMTPGFDRMAAFYEKLLGFRVSDFHEHPFPAQFMRVNQRHHSLALIGSDGPPSVHHMMCEYVHFDDVGRAYDLALDAPESIAVSLGRHLNDHVISFYARTPDGFFMEIGWAGRLVDEETWVPEELDSPSLWGHVRYWLPEERRAQAKKQIRSMAERGIRAPVPAVDSGGFVLPSRK